MEGYTEFPGLFGFAGFGRFREFFLKELGGF